jgi:aspartyl-tRNA(Asn)/glutamyl-tRNA(Gln) amidotransferase subunit B
LEAGETPPQETRGWHEKTNATRSQRTKEGAADYRYFPEPDIPPLVIGKEWFKKIQSQMVTLPEEKMAMWRDQYGLRADYAKTIMASVVLTQKYEEIIRQKDISSEHSNKIMGILINKQMPMESTIEELVKKVTTVDATKITDETKLTELVEEAITALPKPAEDYANGVDKAIAALIGKIMAVSAGKADGGMVKTLLHKRLRK